MKVAATALLATALSTPALAADKPQYGNWGFDATGVDLADQTRGRFFPICERRLAGSHHYPCRQAGLVVAPRDDRYDRGPSHDLWKRQPAKDETNDLEGKVGGFYKAFMDESADRRTGRKVHRAGTRCGARCKIARRTRRTDGPFHDDDFETSLFNITTDIDLKDPKRYAVYLSQCGLGLPDRDYYLKPHFAATQNGLSGLCRAAAASGWLARCRCAGERHSRFRNEDRGARAGPRRRTAMSWRPIIPCRWTIFRSLRRALTGNVFSQRQARLA